MGMGLIESVGSGIVKAENDVALDAISVVDKEVGNGGTIWDEVCANALSGDG